ncbi:PrsW family glutamic-type intramembrane protease [Aestuariimicrobium ganziense]|uniref:PrsW family glutamic-type intramembrane protease n=1 Tax=Aestuariimicrobium ganziense TaxID=2773677 RepID=UPI0019431DE0|nr:PrsW family glutamic-type intramembrane protease [Aestuariimicrobium ganziense]
MDCPRCDTALPEASHFCHACGQDQTSSDTVNRRSYAIKPDEQVRSLRLVSTIMPKGAAERPRTYQIALAIALAATVVSALLGAVPVALMIAAFAIPIVYIVYLYDVNLWEDAPVPVTGLAFVLTFVLTVAFTAAWVGLRGPLTSAIELGGGLSPSLTGTLIAVLLVPIVGELIRQVGPLMLASRPEFDDLMDGLTFGIISGVAFSTADTLVKNWSLFGEGFSDPGQGASTWVALLVLEGFIKPLVVGTATGLACAEFSGLGRGYDGFTPRYALAVVEAIGWNVLFFGGTYLLGFIGAPWVGILLSVLWGLALLAVLVIRVRGVLQTGLMEAALENAARHHTEHGVGEEAELDHCGNCEMPLLAESEFCSACGTAVRTTRGHSLHHRAGDAPLRPAGAGAATAVAVAPAAQATSAEALADQPLTATGFDHPEPVQRDPEDLAEQARLDDEEAR